MSAVRPVVWVCGAHVLLALLLFDPKPFTGGDNFWYMILGESLRTGQGYRDIWLPTAPLHTHYPPVYPLLLAAIGWVWNSVIAFKALSLVCTTAAVGLTYAIARRRTGDTALAAGAALLVGVAPAIIEYSHWELSEAPFLLLVTVALYGFVRDDRSVFAAGAVAALAAYLTRSAGVALVFALAAGLALGKRWTRLAGFAAASAVIVLGWSLYVRSAAAGGGGGGPPPPTARSSSFATPIGRSWGSSRSRTSWAGWGRTSTCTCCGRGRRRSGAGMWAG